MWCGSEGGVVEEEKVRGESERVRERERESEVLVGERRGTLMD